METHPITKRQLRQLLPRRLSVCFYPQRLGIVGEDFREKHSKFTALGRQCSAHSTIMILRARRQHSRRAQLQIEGKRKNLLIYMFKMLCKKVPHFLSLRQVIYMQREFISKILFIRTFERNEIASESYLDR